MLFLAMQRREWRRVSLVGAAVVFLLAGAGASLRSQNIQDGQNPPAAGNEAASQSGVVLLEEYNPLAVSTPQLRVSNLNFDRRFAGNGWGEFLDVVFDIHNNTVQDQELFVFVAAYYETDAVDPRQRRWVPYPVWRHRDFDRETFLVRQISIAPRDIPDDKIWSEEDPVFQRQQLILNRMRNSVAGTAPIEDFRPPFWKYEYYMMQHPTEGLKITLSGETSPPADRTILTNYIPPTEEETRSRVHKTLIQHRYTVEFGRRQAIFRSHHFARFRPNYVFFNRAAILIFDARRAQQTSAADSTEEGPGSALLYKRVIAFNRPLRNN